MNKILGLDLGSSSIGWTLRDENNQFTSGVVTFDAGMVKSQSGGYNSPTKDRREARSKRRLLQAKRYRKWSLLETLLNDYVPLSIEELDDWRKYQKGQRQKFPESELFQKWLVCDFTYLEGTKYKNPYELRVAALDGKVSKHEFGRALYHLVQRRGYKNIGESDFEDLNLDEAKKDDETKKQLEKRDKEGFAKAMEQHNRVIAKVLKYEFLDKGKRARNQYPYRKEYREEFELLCKAQGFDIARNEAGIYHVNLIQQLWKSIIWQRPLRSQKGNIGRCTLEPDKPRCPVSHPLFEIFRAWQFINTIKTFEEIEGEKTKESLPHEIRNKLFLDFFLKKDSNVKFAELKKFLDKQFKKDKQYNYKPDHSTSTMPVCKGLIDVFGEDVKKQILELESYIIGGKAANDKKNITAPKIVQGKYSVFDLWHALYSFDEAYLKTFARNKLGIADETDKKGRGYNSFALLKKNIASSFSDLSVKAISKIIPFLKEGHLYDEAVLLAKMPELFGENWKMQKEAVLTAINSANKEYKWQKTVSTITNSLIDTWKGLPNNEKFAYKNTDYILQEDDKNAVVTACNRHFGEKTWEAKSNELKYKIIHEVQNAYQQFFSDSKRAYRQTPTLDELLKNEFSVRTIQLNGDLYHHSQRENLYLKKIGTKEDGTPRLPIHKDSRIEILPVPLIDSIKNPMFNKALSVLRKLLNEMIVTDVIDNDTTVVIEVARELNDNNKRLAIERYQRERENRRESYRKLLEEFKNNKNQSLNIEENIPRFELWTEQVFDKEKQGLERLKRETILKEKDEVKRYELWMEQQGLCMYTGKMISLSQLFSNDIDIEHTVPRSLLPDNTMANETVCYAWYNRGKDKKTIEFQPNAKTTTTKLRIGALP